MFARDEPLGRAVVEGNRPMSPGPEIQLLDHQRQQENRQRGGGPSPGTPADRKSGPIRRPRRPPRGTGGAPREPTSKAKASTLADGSRCERRAASPSSSPVPQFNPPREPSRHGFACGGDDGVRAVSACRAETASISCHDKLAAVCRNVYAWPSLAFQASGVVSRPPTSQSAIFIARSIASLDEALP